jgi:F-type H+-transporting ATPase subunit epsilon
MAEKTFHIDIVSPSKKVYSGDVISVSAPGICGGFQILYNHTEFLTPVTFGEIKVDIDPETHQHYAISGGIVEVHNNKVIVLAETIERSDEIDASRAQQALDRAEKRIRDKSPEVDKLRAWMSLNKAKTRMKIAEKYGSLNTK